MEHKEHNTPAINSEDWSEGMLEEFHRVYLSVRLTQLLESGALMAMHAGGGRFSPRIHSVYFRRA